MNRDDDEALSFTVATVWREQRVSCPHPDILQAYATQSLSEGATGFIAFHLDESECPYCNAVLEDLRAQQQDAGEAKLSDLRDRLMRSTVAELRRVSGA